MQIFFLLFNYKLITDTVHFFALKYIVLSFMITF